MPQRADAPMSALPSARASIPVLAVIGGAVALMAAYGTSPADAVLYLGYEGLFVLLPGWLVYRALSGRAGGILRQLALGWALGYVLEGLAFVLAAAIGARSLFLAYPLVAGACAFAVARGKGWTMPARRARGSSSRAAWACAVACLLAIAYLALAFFPVTPLPGTGSFNYFQDYPWALSIAAEAKNHWPIEDASVAGEPFPYHWLVHVHWAAASEVTGLDLPVVFFRMFVLPLTASIALQAVFAGRALGRSLAVGLTAFFLIWFVGELQLDTTHQGATELPFLGVFFTLLTTSPSFLFGLVFFLPLVALVGERVRSPEVVWRPGDWVIVGLLAVGAALAKVSIPPILLGALAVYGGWAWVRSRRPPRSAAMPAALLLVVSGVLYLTLYRGHASGLSPDPTAGFDYVSSMPAVGLVKDHLLNEIADFPGERAIISAGAFAFGLLGLMAAQLVGLAWLLRGGLGRLDEAQRWLLSLFAVGLASLLFLDGGGSGNQLYGFFYGLVAGCLLSAQGLVLAWQARPALPGSGPRLAALAALALLLLLALLIAPIHMGLATADRYVLWYGGLIGLLAAAYLAARVAIRSSSWPAAILVAGLLVLVGCLDKPVDTLKPALFDPPGETLAGRRVTPELYRALEWVRDNTPTDSVVAVNSYYTEIGPFEFVYGGFGERRVFLEGWGYSTRSRDEGYGDVVAGQVMPFPRRLALNQAAFAGSPAALREIWSRYGVRYLIVDRINGFAVDPRRLDGAGRVVQKGTGITVFELAAPPKAS